MFCQYCGKPIPDESRFCMSCGSPLNINNDAEKNQISETTKTTEVQTALPIRQIDSVPHNDGYVLPQIPRPSGVSNYTSSITSCRLRIKKKDVLKNNYGTKDGYVEIKDDKLIIYKKETHYMVIPIIPFFVFHSSSKPKQYCTLSRNDIKSFNSTFAYDRKWFVIETVGGKQIAISSLDDPLHSIEDWFNYIDISSVVCGNCHNWIPYSSVTCPICRAGTISFDRVNKQISGKDQIVYFTRSSAECKAIYIKKRSDRTEREGVIEYVDNNIYLSISGRKPGGDDFITMNKQNVKNCRYENIGNKVWAVIDFIDKSSVRIYSSKRTLLSIYALLKK